MQAQVGHISSQRREGARFLALSGEFDLSNTWQIKEAVLEAVKAGEPVIVDLSDVSFMDASLLRVLLGARSAARSNDIGLTVVPPRDPSVWRVASLVDLPLAA